MKRKLLRIREMVGNKPQLISPDSFNIVLDYLNERNLSMLPDIDVQMSAEDVDSYLTVNSDTATAIINLSGLLTYRSMFDMATCSENVSYQYLKTTFTDLMEQGITNIGMVVDSGGGQAHGCFDSARYVRNLLNENNASLSVFVDGRALSAAYVWSSIADNVFMSHDSMVGSVGVVVQLINNTKALEKGGYERKFVFSGDNKIPFDEEGNFSKGFLSELQEQCDELYDEFISHVSTYRGLDKKVVRDTQAAVLTADKAVEVGFADGVKTFEEFMGFLSDNVPSDKKEHVGGYISRFMNVQEDVFEMEELEELKAALASKEELIAGQEATFAAKMVEAEQLTVTLQGKVEELEAKMAEAAVAARHKALAEVLPADQVDAQMEALAGLSDEAFNTVVATMGSLKVAKTQSDDFKELGDVGVEVDAPEMSEQDKLDALVAAKLSK